VGVLVCSISMCVQGIRFSSLLDLTQAQRLQAHCPTSHSPPGRRRRRHLVQHLMQHRED